MKNKWKYEVVNNQEDEDGYSLYPDSVIIYESAKGNQNTNSDKNTVPGSAKLAMISPETKRRVSQFILSPSAKLAVPITMETMSNQKDYY